MDNVNWDAYWRNAESSAAHLDGGPQDESLQKFWSEYFSRQFSSIDQNSFLLDVACGNGAVPRFALASSIESNFPVTICGLDDSAAAVKEMLRRDSVIHGVAAPLRQMPFNDDCFDIVTSQFGIEYAGSEGIPEALRVLKRGGSFAAVMHQKDGAIYRECQINLQAIESFSASRVLENFRSLFQLVVVDASVATRSQVQASDRDFARSVALAEKVFSGWGKTVASGTLFKIYQDIGHMYSRLRTYDANELFEWVQVMQNELQTYGGRMSSMLNAALDKDALSSLLNNMRQLGMRIEDESTLKFGPQSQPSAWVLQAVKEKKKT